MRYSVTTVVVLLSLSGPLTAQARHAIDKGSVLVGGSAQISRTTSESGTSEATSTSVFVNPRALLFVAPRVAVGGDVSIGRISAGDVSSSSVGVGPAFRYYLRAAGATSLPYLGAAARISRASFEGPGSADGSETSRDVEGVLGIDWMISRQVGIAGEAFVAYFSRGSGPSRSATTFGVRFGIDAFFLR